MLEFAVLVLVAATVAALVAWARAERDANGARMLAQSWERMAIDLRGQLAQATRETERFRDAYIEAVKREDAPSLSETPIAREPISVREADRLAVQRRNTIDPVSRVRTTDMMPVPLADNDVAPPPRVTLRGE